MKIAGRGFRVSALLAAAGALTTGCVSSVVVESDFPTPLIEPLPVSIGVVFDEELENYIHVEELPQQSAWVIDLGDASTEMLSLVFDTLFTETRTLDGLPPGPDTIGVVDGVLRAGLDRFEFDVPISQRDEFVEVWIQYVLTLYEPDGSVVTQWPVVGYGKAELTRSREQSVHRAAVIALREAGAAISTAFAEQPDIDYWLQERRNDSALSADLGT